MSGWFLLALSVVCGFLAYDASRQGAASSAMPIGLTAERLGQSVEHLSAAELEALRVQHQRVGIGKLGAVTWLFAFMSASLAIAALVEFFA
jgi:hypothetical protein